MTTLGDESEEIAALVREILQRDRRAPGYALLVTRGLIAALPTEDAVTLVKCPQPIDAAALIG